MLQSKQTEYSGTLLYTLPHNGTYASMHVFLKQTRLFIGICSNKTMQDHCMQ